MADKKHYYYGRGRRKSSTVQVRLTSGKGNIVVNDKSAEEYFDGDKQLLWRLAQPMTVVDMTAKYDITLKASGGGLSSQVDASVLAISNALAELNEDLRGTLKKAGFIKRDSREKERKKYGLKRARKKEQYSKR